MSRVPCKYHHGRLLDGLVKNAYDTAGNCLVHQGCLAEELGVGAWSVGIALLETIDVVDKAQAFKVSHTRESKMT